MFFKRLEIFGFKSFAEKTKLDFQAGVTAIVGPNGCGKSNISDSIKWVLGEQSVRSLRGSSMEDIIFHGADGMAPIGFAEVSLTISNQSRLLPLDYEEVTITRRIFRSGESEYLINKIPVRLKDILELLMGTGMGLPSYSLMEQGKVDRILSSRPEDRRTIFEEASDITKYKSKKEEALRKLERTQENLQRIGDIIVEVKRQINSMQRQVNKARRYQEEFSRLKECESKVAQYQYQNFDRDKRELQNRVKALQEEETSLSAKLNSAASSLEQTRRRLASVNEDISQHQAKSYEVCAAIETAGNKITLDQERIEELSRRREELTEQLQGLEKKACSISQQIEEAQGRMKAIEQKKQARLSSLAEKEESIQDISDSVKKAQKEISEDKTKEVELLTQQTKVKNNLTKLAANLSNFSARLRRLDVERKRTEQDSGGIEEKCAVCVQGLEALKGQSKHLNREIWDLKSSHNIKLEKRQALLSRLEALNHQLTALESKLNFLTEITKKYEGFCRGVKAVMSAKDENSLNIEGGCALLADLVEVAPQYQASIERALGENAQAIVVENEQAALCAINYLKEKDSGRANFICLDKLEAANGNAGNAQTLPDCLGAACRFIKTDPKYQGLLECLLAGSFIVQDMETAHRLWRDLGPLARLITLEGEILTRTSIDAGACTRDLDSGLLSRRERISQTQAELQKLKKEKTALADLNLKQQSELEEISVLIQQKDSQFNELKIKLANKETEKSGIDAEKKRFEEELSILNLEIGETNTEVEQLRSEQEKLEQEALHLQESQSKLSRSIQQCQGLVAEKNQQRETTLVEIAEIKTQALALDRETEDAQVRLEMVVESEKERKAAQEAKERELTGTSDKIEQLRQEIAQFKSQVGSLSESKIKVEQQMSQANQLRQKLFASVQDLERASKASQGELDQCREKKAGLQVKLTQSSYKQDSLRDKMQQAYQINLAEALEGNSEIAPPQDSLFGEIEHLKSRLDGLGPVNLVAIEENDQLQQRYSFLVSQQEDLTNAQESLRKAITQINRTAKEMFAETFGKIQLSFKEYFRILFGGGDARLVLLDEDNILESGIEIVVRPPGKKLQNISLLSGGEKALTAIALLFAVFKVKPSPFCILDEVDAPLDEANVDRFTNLLNEFLKTSQFIIVTHNKKTINMADIMYGITMEKSGVSKIVSVRFTEENQLPVEEMVQEPSLQRSEATEAISKTELLRPFGAGNDASLDSYDTAQ